MAYAVEECLPYIYAVDIQAANQIGVQIGDAIITPQAEVWYDELGVPTYSLLVPNGASIDQAVHPVLYAIYLEGGTSVLPTLSTHTDSPFPYRVVADYTGE